LRQADLQWGETAKHHTGIPLWELLAQVQGLYKRERFAPPKMFGIWLRLLRKSMRKKVSFFVRSKALRKRYKPLLGRTAGDTTLQDYFGSCKESDMEQSYQAVDDLTLIARAVEGDNEAVTQLMAKHGKAVRGMIRARVNSDTDAEDVWQQTWAEVCKKLPIFDPARAPFEAMLKFWAWIMIKRYRDDLGTDGNVILFSELESQYKDGDGELEVEEILARRGGDAGIGHQPDPGLPEEFDGLLRLVFLTESPPHQLLAFLLVKLLEWKPAEVVDEVSDKPLSELAAWLERELLTIFGKHGAVLEECFKHLEPMLQPDRTLSEVLVDPRTRKTYQNLLDRVVCGTALRDYYNPDPSEQHSTDGCAENVTNWCVSVQRRVFKAKGNDEEETTK
jgi:DNA-directed RNA polymerase specialized sigma24 family protein